MSNKSDIKENEKIGAQLQKAREMKKVTQEEMAEAAGLTKNHISKIERGLSKASIATLNAYCQKLEMTPNEVLEYPQDKIPMELAKLVTSLTKEQQGQLADILKIIKKPHSNHQ